MFPQAKDGPQLTKAVPQPAPADLATEHLEHEICQLSAHLQAGLCRWLELLCEYDRRNGWWSWGGSRSLSDWVSWRCAIDPRTARQYVAVARSLHGLPLIRQGFSEGRLSYSKVRALTRVADPDSEAELLELARHATAAQLERMLCAYGRISSQQAHTTHERAYLDADWDQDGSLCIRGRLSPDDGALFLEALEQSRDALRQQAWAEERGSGSAEPPRHASQGGSAEPRPQPIIRNAEAFSALVESALARGPTELRGSERTQIVIHIDAQALTHDAAGACHLGDGPAIAPETARRLGCDASLVSSLELDGRQLSMGRRTRAIPTSIRRALDGRDRGCQFPGCERRRFTDAHHIRHWAHGGETSLENLVLLCRHHHRLVHEGGYSLARDAHGQVVVRHPGGWTLPTEPARHRGDPTQIATRNRRAGLDIGSGTCLTGTGEPMDLGLAVDAVLHATRHGRESAPEGAAAPA